MEASSLVKYWWKGMQADVRRYCRSCLICASRKGPGRALHPRLQSIPVGGPFHRVGACGCSTASTFIQWKQVCYSIILILWIKFTKWPEVFATSDQTAETIARLLVEHVISSHGVPELLPRVGSAPLGPSMGSYIPSMDIRG